MVVRSEPPRSSNGPTKLNKNEGEMDEGRLLKKAIQKNAPHDEIRTIVRSQVSLVRQ
jgi:hypothetical protein